MDDGATTRRPISAAQWLAARALSEGAPPTRKRIAAVLGGDDSAVYARAGLEGWRRPDFRRPAVRQAHAHFMEIACEAGGAFESEDVCASADGATDAPWAERDEFAGWQGGAGRAPVDGSGNDHGVDGGGAGTHDGTDVADDPVRMLARGTRFMSRRLDRLMTRAERGGTLNKIEIDNLTALGRMMERWETLARERAEQEETDLDDKIAEALRTIDRRVLQLARAEAERMVAAGYRP